MNQQLSLFSLPDPAPNRFRLLFAVFPNPDAGNQISELVASLRTKHELPGRPRPPHILHVTMELIGDYPDMPQAEIDRLQQILPQMKSVMPPVEVTFDRAMSFQNRKKCPFVLLGSPQDNQPLRRLRESLAVELAGHGFPLRPKAAFVPHVTMIYDERCFAEEAVEPIRWTTREVGLVLSHLGETKYDHLGSWLFAS